MAVKGLDDFSKQFLGHAGDEGAEYVQVSKGQKVDDEAVRKYNDSRVEDFINRSGSFTEDLIGFIVEQKQRRNLSDTETVFGVALATINLRNAYGSPQAESEKEAFTDEKRAELLKEFDRICYGAQKYWENNQDD
jgi:hypothetical protein